MTMERIPEPTRADLGEVLAPEGAGAQDDFTRRMLAELGFVGAKRLADGTYVGVQRLMFTLAICVGTTERSPYQRRYCYDDAAECLGQFAAIRNCDDTPSGYIAYRP